MTLDELVGQTKIRNVWIEEGVAHPEGPGVDAAALIRVYVRYSQRCFHWLSEDLFSCLDLANVEVHESMRGQGIFTEFFDRYLQACAQTQRTPYIEAVHNRRLRVFLLGREFVPIDALKHNWVPAAKGPRIRR